MKHNSSKRKTFFSGNNTGIAKRLATLVSAFALTLVALNGAVAPAQAASVNDARIRNGGVLSYMRACKDWGVSSCASGSPQILLAKGQVTPWDDADGVWLPNNMRADGTINGWCNRSGVGRWEKVSGYYGGIKTIVLHYC